MDSIQIANSVLFSTDHDRLRRMERQIDKITLQEARRYGMSEKQRKGRIKYTYAGHVFIYDKKKNRAITSWKTESRPCTKSGTKFYKPILIQKSEQHDTRGLNLSHDEVTTLVRQKHKNWSSHSVIVVDMSGSMRDDDVDGARCRADGVWTSLARDYVKEQLETNACSLFDVVSVIAMRETAEVVVECEPMTFVLYNKLVSLRDWDEMKPHGHGYYLPALREASRLLSINAYGTCALNLMFFSDGKPSDLGGCNKVRQELIDMAGEIGSTFGRRLNFVCIGMAGQGEKFDTLQNMVKETKLFGCQANFERPSLDSTSLSQVMSSSVTSSLATKTEMSSLETGATRMVRTDVERERANAPDDSRVNENWSVYQSSSDEQYVQNVWVWNSEAKDFSRLIDPRCNTCYKEVASNELAVSESKGAICESCNACFFCTRCCVVGNYQTHSRSNLCTNNLRDRRSGFLVGGPHLPGPRSYNVAVKKQAFGEGAERLAFKFRFVGPNSRFEGPGMVAKESRFVEDLMSTRDYLTSHRHAYHRSFMRTQATASRFAITFNAAVQDLDRIPLQKIVRIEFLKPFIFELEDRKKGTNIHLLVEPMIPGTYKKFTDNFGAKNCIKRDFSEENKGIDLFVAAALLGRQYKVATHSQKAKPRVPAGGGLGAILEEDSEEDDDSEDDDSHKCYGEESSSSSSDSDSTIDVSQLRNEDFLHSFSHFTYVRSGGRYMVVDLQGALQTAPDGRKTYLLTDPAIHYKYRKNDAKKKRQYGRTDLGRRGMRAFFETHKCNGICRLFGFRDKSNEEALDRLFRVKNRRDE
ncbi:alpha-kinase family protein [Nitzschia inconspicua]|uniref:Alpha-kinase family protein n=1 Tax=Nitzschia inconspicua TaxID=303405 RepID=A0A9K3KDE4_9STRA|nr:alpha-kinase family protein [Nitzschia inconspicua]